MLSLVPGISLILFAVTYVYPLYATWSTLRQRNVDHIMQWLCYWSIFAVFQLVDSYALFLVRDFIPLFLEGQCLFFLWLVHPSSLGSRYLWAEAEQYYARYDPLIQEKLGIFGTQAGAYGEASSVPPTPAADTGNKSTAAAKGGEPQTTTEGADVAAGTPEGAAVAETLMQAMGENAAGGEKRDAAVAQLSQLNSVPQTQAA